MVDPRHDSAKNLYKVNFVAKETKERVLLNRIAQGDRHAFWEMWTLYQDYLYHRSVVWMGGSHDDAQEVMSLASLKAWQKLPDHAHKIINLKSWLNRFTHNLCIDIHRQRKHQAIGVENVDDVPLNNQDIASATDPESKLVQKELYIYIRYWIDDLASRLRNPLILSYYQG
ncbi:MAG: RNA polymerase sigma factor, partial [Cyanobacteria bacterium P01_A01_bin.83]